MPYTIHYWYYQYRVKAKTPRGLEAAAAEEDAEEPAARLHGKRIRDR